MDKLLQYIPYEILIETYGGPNHEIITLQNNLAIFALFLFTGVDKLIVSPDCLGILYLNTVDRTMSVINIFLANFALKMKPFQGLLYEVLSNILSMKQVRKSVSEY